jgi:TRAP-type C4-dicarboxylate transport system permease small subunit
MSNGRSNWLLVAIDYLVRVESWIAGVLVVLIVVLVFTGVIARYVFVHPLATTNDIASYSFTVMVSFGLALAMKRKKHTNVEIMTVHLKPRTKNMFSIISLIFIVFYCIVAAWAGWLLAVDSLQHHVASIEARIPLFIPQICIVLGFFAFGLVCVTEASKLFLDRKGEKTS